MAGIGDLMRPADKLSLNQSISLAATGLIWSRVCLVLYFSVRIKLNRFFFNYLFLVLYGYNT